MERFLAHLIPLADYDGHMDWGDGGNVVMVVSMVVLWIVVVAAIVWLVREIAPHRRGSTDAGDDPLRLLDRRLADGTISADDYRERRALLAEREGRPGGA